MGAQNVLDGPRDGTQLPKKNSKERAVGKVVIGRR